MEDSYVSFKKNVYSYIQLNHKNHKYNDLLTIDDESEILKYLHEVNTEIVPILYDANGYYATDDPALEKALSDDREQMVHKYLNDTLLASKSKNELPIILLRFGLTPYIYDHTIEEIKETMGLSRERIRQIESSAIKKLKHAVFRSYFRKYFENDFSDIPLYNNTAVNQYTTPEKEIVWSRPLSEKDTTPPYSYSDKSKSVYMENDFSDKATEKEIIDRIFTIGGRTTILTIEENGYPSTTEIYIDNVFLQKAKENDLKFLKRLALSKDRIISRKWLTRFILDIDAA